MSLSRLAVLVKTIKALRGVLVALVFMMILLPVAVYVLMSSDWACDRIRDIGKDELSTLLGTQVEIGAVDFSPFNKMGIYDIEVKDDNDSTALTIKEIGARFEIWDLLLKRKVIIDYATVNGLDLRLYQDSVGAPLNIAQIIKRLSKQEPDKEPAHFKLRLNDIELSHSRVSYDILTAQQTPGRFNPSHISVDSVHLVAFAPVIANDQYSVMLRTLSMSEQSGFRLEDLTARIEITDKHIQVGALKLQLPNTLLDFADIKADISGYQDIPKIIKQQPLHLQINEGSHIYLPDLKPFVPKLEAFDYTIDVSLDADISAQRVDITDLVLEDTDDIIYVQAKGSIEGINDPADLKLQDITIDARTNQAAINQLLASNGANISPTLKDLLPYLGPTTIKGNIDGTIERATLNINVSSNLAKGNIDGLIIHPKGTSTYTLNGKVKVDSLSLGKIISDPNFNTLSANADIQGTFTPKAFTGDAKASIGHIDYKGYRFHNIEAEATVTEQRLTAAMQIDDPNLRAEFSGDAYHDGDKKALVADLRIGKFRPDTISHSKKYPGYTLSGSMHVNGYGYSVDKISGDVTIDDVKFQDKEGNGITLNNMNIFADNISSKGRIAITSDYVNGTIDGSYNFSTLPADIKSIYQSLIPALTPTQAEDTADTPADTPESEAINKFSVDLTLSNCDRIFEFFKLPVIPIAETTINGNFNSLDKSLFLNLDIPWIESGNSYIQYTNAILRLNAAEDRGTLYLTSYIPTKKGNMDVETNIYLNNGILDTSINWSLEPEKPISGIIDFSTEFERTYDDQLLTHVRFNPGSINFGDEIWEIKKSLITYGNNKAIINDFSMQSQRESLRVNGVIGDEDDDVLYADLNNIQLINIFETLDIDAVLISGFATGKVTCAALLSKKPIIKCDKLNVKQIGYNYCTLGDAIVKLNVDDGGKLFTFSADITQPKGTKSYLDGYIEPETEKIELNIDADHVNVGFMQPFMKAFTSDVGGEATGKAKLFGTFKDIDLTGDLTVDSLRIKIDFTNTWYYASDRVTIRPGMIELPNITIRDEYGHKALLNGWVSHRYFHDAAFEFKVTNARRFLSYDTTEKDNAKWYGRIFADGSVTVKGAPGIVDIGVNMTTASNSTFTLVLSDRAEADEYSFINFRDLTPKPRTDSILDKNTVPERVRNRGNSANSTTDAPTAYNIDITMGVTPQATINIIMDPVGGDRIRSNGSGSMHLYYGSSNNDLRLYGTYTLDRGSYNFTLQDLIIKDFTIKSGSYVTFTGDPYAADVNIEAYYQVNANLSDLDESFLQDKELNRTNVPVRALMIVKGDIRQPNITFDLELPTLTQDTYRKVKSIVSTEDMMNKQIIYLLALNRFYTPEYMGATTKGNELFSVASSTLSSQLSNMLGKLSENWSIAPNLRSDRGDFSDLEVDVTLSSSLLNNRLLFNGNFGYRDKSLNTNQFIGDFDVEYLLNRSGEWRLKAYNRYNDQNYYLRTAQTTQGVGLVYRRDFDSTFKFLGRLFKRNNDIDTIDINETIIVDTVPKEKATVDTIINQQAR